MKLRLFALRMIASGKFGPDHYATKPEAKKARDELNAAGGPTWVVTPGPDHRRYKG